MSENNIVKEFISYVEKNKCSLKYIAKESKICYSTLCAILRNKYSTTHKPATIKLINDFMQKVNNNEKCSKAEEVKDSYISLVNNLVNTDTFSGAIKTMLDLKPVIKVADQNKVVADAYVSIIDRQLRTIIDVIQHKIFD